MCRRAAQLQDPIDGCQSAAMARSAFGKIYTYNLLPDNVAEQKSIKGFQRLLQRGLQNACRRGVPNWNNLFSKGAHSMSVDAFRYMLECDS